VAKNHNFGHFCYLGDCYTDPILPMRAKFGVLEHTHGLHLQAKFHLNVFIVPAAVAKNTILGIFWHFGGLLHRPPFTDEG